MTVSPQSDAEPKSGMLANLRNMLAQSATRSNGKIALFGCVTFVAGFVATKAFEEAWSRVFPSQIDEQISTISAHTTAINDAVNGMNAELQVLASELPENLRISLEAHLDEIARNAAGIQPAATSLRGIAKGAGGGSSSVNAEPYQGSGEFYLDVQGGESGASARICDGLTVVFVPGSEPSVRLNGPRNTTTNRLLVNHRSGQELRDGNGTVVTFNPSFEEDGTVKVMYTCGSS